MSREQYEMHVQVPNPGDTLARPKSPTPQAHPRPVSARSSITARDPVTSTTTSSIYPILIIAVYTALTLLSWILLCILSKRPIRGGFDSYEKSTIYRNDWRPNNERHIKTAQVLQTIATLLTIPVTSAVCSMAAVAYLQVGNLRQSLTLTQVMALADQQWASPSIFRRFHRTHSLPLIVAFVLTLIGSISQILQSSFVSYKSIQVATESPNWSYNYDTGTIVKDIPDLFAYSRSRSVPIVYHLRNLLNTASEYDYDVNLWNIYARPGERTLNLIKTNDERWGEDWVSRSFYSDVPYNFSAGVRDHIYAPRINSTTNITLVSEEEFSTNCRNETETGGFYARHERSQDGFTFFSVVACMVGDKRISPWKATRDRQDIQEVLYIQSNSSSFYDGAGYFKVTTNSSLGYFEVPSYRSGGKPGPLLDKDPLGADSLQIPWKPDRDMKRDGEQNITSPGNRTLASAPNQGPLTALALALFGQDSMIESSFQFEQLPRAESDEPEYTGVCTAPMPFGNFLDRGCFGAQRSLSMIENHVRAWLNDLISTGSNSIGLFNVGIYLANKAWLGAMDSRGKSQNYLRVLSDLGVDAKKPEIPLVQMFVASALLGVHLLGLWTLAIFAFLTMPFVKSLGAEVMVRMGTAYSDVLYASEGKEWKHTADMVPGFVGDGSPDTAEGKIQVGAHTSLRPRRKYEMLR